MARCICVFSSSSDAVETAFFDLAHELGRAIGLRGDSIIFGGCNVGLMGAVARGTHAGGGKVIGAIPEFIAQRGINYAECDEMIVTADMRERKAVMERRADAFIALPGGFGTLEEILEIITLKQLQQHAKPVVFLNHAGFYDPLAALFEHMYEHRFAKPSYREMYHFAPDVPGALAYLDSYSPPAIESKWFNAGGR
jgi:uncharacterized protein (TIGR00730 family)